jgi:hypothetical protein
MARVGYAAGLEIYVNTNDAGSIPHFHIRDKDDWDKFHSCIKILSAEYFAHEGKEDTLNSKQRKKLQEFLSSPADIDIKGATIPNNWKYICILWNSNNSSTRIPKDAKMPDYRQLR